MVDLLRVQVIVFQGFGDWVDALLDFDALIYPASALISHEHARGLSRVWYRWLGGE